MDNQIIKMPDIDGLAKKSGNVTKFLLLAGVAALIWKYVLPILTGLVIGSIEFMVASAIALILIFILFNRKFWRGVNYLCQWVGEKVLSLGIEMNRWQILYNQVEERQKALENVRKQNQILRGEQATAQKGIDENNENMRLAAQDIKNLQAKIQKGDPNGNFEIMLQSAQTKFANSKRFIDTVKPTLNNLNNLVTITDRVYRKGTSVISDLKDTIKTLKQQFDITSSGSKAMQATRVALWGNPNSQEDAMKAFDSISKQIGEQLGVINQGIEETTRLMDEGDLRDASKIQLAAQAAEAFDANANFDYAETVKVKGQITDVDSGNKFMDILK